MTLDSRFPASPKMIALMAAYQGQLKDMGLSGLGIRPLPHPLKRFNGDFVGTDACTNCHEESYRVWKKSPHSHAFATLKNVNPPRNFDPECISCHVVGWHPTKFFPYQSGYLSEKETPKLINVGCEDCHGPGQLHVLGRKPRHAGPAGRRPQDGRDHQGRIGRSELAEAELLVVPRSGQQPRVQVSQLHRRDAKHARARVVLTSCPSCRCGILHANDDYVMPGMVVRSIGPTLYTTAPLIVRRPEGRASPKTGLAANRQGTAGQACRADPAGRDDPAGMRSMAMMIRVAFFLAISP